MLGIREIIQDKEEFETTKYIDKTRMDKLEDSFEMCYNLAKEIYSALETRHRKGSKEFFKHYRETFVALDRTDNKWLRFAVLRGKISAQKFVKLSVEDLQSEAEKKRKEMMEQKFIEEGLMIEENNEIVIKSHKGEEVIEKESSHKKAQRLNVEDDPSKHKTSPHLKNKKLESKRLSSNSENSTETGEKNSAKKDDEVEIIE